MANRLTQIATRTGDDGTTGLGDGARVPKDSLRIQAIGEVDELNSTLGVLLAEPLPESIRSLLGLVQQELFDVGGELSIPGYTLLKVESVLRLDEALEEYNSTLPRLAEFILGREEMLNDTPRQYLNRLSDLLFVLSRVLNKVDGETDVYWRSERLARQNEDRG
jgi:cob(I)alamin adenosyltransferase